MCVHVAGCAFNAHEIDPRPAPRATRSTHALVVQVDEAIADDFLLEEELGAPALSVRGFRRALVVGLERARDGAFAAPKDGTPAWRLVVVEARPRLVPQDYDEHGKAVLFTAELAYRAVLFDPLMQQAGERTSLVLVPGSFRGVSDGSPLIARAIELVADETMAFVDEEIARATAGGAPTPEK